MILSSSNTADRMWHPPTLEAASSQLVFLDSCSLHSTRDDCLRGDGQSGISAGPHSAKSGARSRPITLTSSSDCRQLRLTSNRLLAHDPRVMTTRFAGRFKSAERLFARPAARLVLAILSLVADYLSSEGVAFPIAFELPVF